MNLSDAVNGLYTQSLSAKRYVDKEQIKLLVSGADERKLVEEFHALQLKLAHLVNEIKKLTAGLSGLHLGELRKLSDQLGLPTDGLSKDELIAQLLELRKVKNAET